MNDRLHLLLQRQEQHMPAGKPSQAVVQNLVETVPVAIVGQTALRCGRPTQRRHYQRGYIRHEKAMRRRATCRPVEYSL